MLAAAIYSLIALDILFFSPEWFLTWNLENAIVKCTRTFSQTAAIGPGPTATSQVKPECRSKQIADS